MLNLNTVQLASILAIMLVVLVLVLLHIKKTHFDFEDLAYIISYGAYDDLERYYGNCIPKTGVTFSGEECTIGTQLMIADKLGEESNMAFLKCNMIPSDVIQKAYTYNRSLRKRIFKENEEYNRESIKNASINRVQIRFRKMKRVDKALSEREVKVKFNTILHAVDTRNVSYMCKADFIISYTTGWYAVIDDIKFKKYC